MGHDSFRSHPICAILLSKCVREGGKPEYPEKNARSTGEFNLFIYFFIYLFNYLSIYVFMFYLFIYLFTSFVKPDR